MTFLDNTLILNYNNNFQLKFSTANALLSCLNKKNDIKVSAAKIWDKTDSIDKTISIKEENFDWTYTTDYLCSIILNQSLSKANNVNIPSGLIIETFNQDNNDNKEEEEEEVINLKILSSNETLPYELLKSQDDPILLYDEIDLYEDELHDNGISKLSLKIRVMPTYYFILMRFFLRVDNVLIKIIDTRIFHMYNTNYILFNQQHHSATFEQLKSLHLPINNRLYTDPNIFKAQHQFNKIYKNY